MKRKVLVVVYIILILITLKMVYNTVLNSILVSKYNNGEYSEKYAEPLTKLNFIQSYVANYNYGNIFYQNGEYESAIRQYQKALDGIVPKNKRCSIRINYALAILKTVDVDEKDQDSIKNAIKTYEEALEVLTQEECDIHNLKAEQLKKDIEREIERLKRLQNSKNDSDKDDNQKDDNKTSEKNETIENKIQNIKENAIKEQRETESLYKGFNKDTNHNGKNW